MEELRDPRSFVPRMAQHRCAISFWERCSQMTVNAPFVPYTPDLDESPRPPARYQPRVDIPDMLILVPSKPKGAFQWPPNCLWPFTEIGHHKWEGDA
jgi:hypothetical protein